MKFWMKIDLENKHIEDIKVLRTNVKNVNTGSEYNMKYVSNVPHNYMII